MNDNEQESMESLLVKLADSIEALADNLQKNSNQQYKLAATSDYGTLDSKLAAGGSDPFTSWLIGS